MWIKNTNEAVQRLYNDDFMDEPVEFNSNGTANVEEELANSLIENIDTIVKYEKNEETEE